MDEKSSRTSKVAASILLTVNIIVMVFCCFLFAFALWVIASPSTLSAAIEFTGSPTIKALLPLEVLTLSLGIGMALVAIVLFFISFMGFYGAIIRSQFLLFMYSTLVLLILLLECALLYYFSTSLIEKGLQEGDGQWTHALRLVFSCCDKNYTIPETKPPWSCCGSHTYPDNCTFDIVYEKNCQETITNWLHRNQIAVYTSLAAVHLILSSCSIVRRHRSSSLSHS